MTPFLAEFVGTALLILLGNGVVGNVVLAGTKGNGSGWIVITWGWGMAVFVAVFTMAAFSGAHINPAVSIGLAIANKFDWALVPIYVAAQFLGAMPLDGQRVYGHMDYAKVDPSLGWRFTDAWLSMAGVGDKGLPNGSPVDDWGIRAEDCHPVGSSVSRGGATNSPAAIYALRTYLDWLERFAPPEARSMTFTDAGPVPARGDIAQQVFWYTAFTPDMVRADSRVMNADGSPKWRVAPSPHGAYWEPGMKLGYQDCGAWTLPAGTPLERRRAAWLYAQFCVCKTVSLKKTLVGLTPIRESDLQSQAMSDAAPSLGGLVEFYRSPARMAWTPTGLNVPDYALLAQLWWTRIGQAVSGRASPRETMDALAQAQDETLERLAHANADVRCGPAIGPAENPKVWLARPGAPKPALSNEKPPGRTIAYADLLASWQEGPS